MPLSPTDAALVADMKQREFHLKNRQRVTDAILFEVRRYRNVVAVIAGLLGALVGAAIFFVVELTMANKDGWPQLLLVDIVLGAIIGVQVGRALLRGRWGKVQIAKKEQQLYDKYTSELHAGRRWLQFYYGEENISEYVPQILYFIEGEGRFDSVADALAFAKQNRRTSDPFASRALARFTKVASESTVVVVSSADDDGRPTSRVMRFVKSDRPGVWYVTTAPEGHKVHEFDQGRIALITSPTDAGATISSNRVRIRRAAVSFPEIAHLYREQVPGYVDRLTDDDQQRELVYELALHSAKVDTWLEHDVVEFGEGAPPSSG